MSIEITRGICLYKIDENYYITKDRAFTCLGLCESSYRQIVNQSKAKKWLEKKGFNSCQTKQIPSSDGSELCEMFDWQSWILLMEYLSRFQQYNKSIVTLNKITQTLMQSRFEAINWVELNIK
ncbi:MAG: hypothetical protein RLZZ135_1091 [Cyanobacteriota bacterium]|jgi:hypothetical protein